MLGMMLAGSAIVGAQAQGSYPARPITMVVPLPAGGTADLLCRLAAERMSGFLGQQVVVDNRPGGAGGRVGTESVMRSAPDGHTLLCAPQLTFSITHLLFAKAAFDTRGMEPVSVLATYPLTLLGRGNLPAGNLPEFIAYARANPGKLNYGSPGYGTSPQLSGELFKAMSGTFIVHIPFSGIAPAVTAVVGGQVSRGVDLQPQQVPNRVREFRLAGGSRRTIYGYIDRADLFEELNTFDFANPSAAMGKRYETTVPQQALFLMNNALVEDESLHLSRNILGAKHATDKDRIRQIYLATVLHEPSEVEIRRAQKFLKEQTRLLRSTPPTPIFESLPDPEWDHPFAHAVGSLVCGLEHDADGGPSGRRGRPTRCTVSP
jgi:hypothetical protein